MKGGLHIVAVGGALRETSSGASALRFCLRHAERAGARTQLFTGEALRLPLYDPQARGGCEASRRLVQALREADGVILASPGYHGGLSGTVKNALDYTEEMAGDPRPYLDGRAVGCIASAAGWQGSAATLTALRAVAHALRGWPTPLGVTMNSSEPLFDAAGECASPGVASNLEAMTGQVMTFAAMHVAYARAA